MVNVFINLKRFTSVYLYHQQNDVLWNVLQLDADH